MPSGWKSTSVLMAFLYIWSVPESVWGCVSDDSALEQLTLSVGDDGDLLHACGHHE